MIKIRGKLPVTVLLIVCSFAFSPSTLALELRDFSVPQGETLELTIPRFEYSEATGSYDGQTIPFYEFMEQIDQSTAITRGEFMQLIHQNPLPTPEGSTPPPPPDTPLPPTFPDINPTNPFATAIAEAAARGIINGYEDGLFHPYDPLTRGQAAKIIMNAYHPPLQPDIKFPYLFDVPPDYSLHKAIVAAFQAGIFHGYRDGSMQPNRSISFQEAQLIIYRTGNFGDKFNSITTRPAFRAYLGIHRLSATGSKPLTITLKNPAATTLTATLTVTKQNFATVHFSLSTDKTKLFEKTYQDNTWEMIDAAKANSTAKQLWQDPFIVPTTGKTTLGFGDKLYINGVYSGSHFGIDYANPEGTPVYAANTGIVTLADSTPAYGNTIVIDHGQNIFTMYLHLKDLHVKTGDTVKKGDLIASMGQTGIATGPHLHFTNFIGDIIVDSQYWYDKN